MNRHLSEPFVQKHRKPQSTCIIQCLRKRFVLKIYLRNISFIEPCFFCKFGRLLETEIEELLFTKKDKTGMVNQTCNFHLHLTHDNTHPAPPSAQATRTVQPRAHPQHQPGTAGTA